MFRIMPQGNGKTEENDPEMMARMLEIELMQKRASWQQAGARRKNLRLISFVFLFFIIAGSFFAFYLLSSSGTLSELKSNRSNAAQTTPSPTQPPH